MRMLLRRGAHREQQPGVTVLAASPDTPARERWQWQASVVEGADAVCGIPDGARVVTLPLGRPVYGVVPAVLHVAAEPSQAVPSVERIELSGEVDVTRGTEEVMVLLVDEGEALVEGRHTLRHGDVLVLEGDDPHQFTVCGTPRGPRRSSMSVVRLVPPAGRKLGWVP